MQHGSVPTAHSALDAPLDVPLRGATFPRAIARMLRGHTTFTGRASRSEHWWGVLFVAVATMVALVPFALANVGQVMAIADPTPMTAATSAELASDVVGWSVGAIVALVPCALVLVALLVPTVALQARRHHDAGLSAWMLLLAIPTAGIWPLVAGLLPASDRGARFDKRPVDGAPGTVGQAFADPRPGTHPAYAQR